ncbi:protease-like activity factor CPAF [Bdellovibrionota bacterium FG-2]
MKTLFAIALTFASFQAHNQAHASDSLNDDVTTYLYGMKSVYRTQYAPAAWKKQFASYDLDTEFKNAIDAVQSRPELSLADSRTIFKNFIYAMKDYHTSISFVTTEAATLPLTVRGTDKNLYLVNIDRAKLPQSTFPFSEGDELISVNGKSALAELAALQAETPANVPATDKALAEATFFRRRASRGIQVPQGPVTLGIKRNGANEVSLIEMIWDYTPEKIAPRHNLVSSALSARHGLFHPQMNAQLSAISNAETPFDLGARKPCTPTLGKKIWQSSIDDFYHAYIFQTPERKLVGYIRISSYEQEDYDLAIEEFAKTMELFESTTDAMVIDQINNPGGSVFYLYALASMLSPAPLKTPLHRMSVTQADVAEALDIIGKLANVKTDAEAQTLFKGELNGYPASYEFARFYLSYAQFIVSEWTAGRKLTHPYWIGGVDHINPSQSHYTKPILFLTNHLDFSGGDFLPAILQDNKRVTVMGSQTAGAGGYVYDVQIPNNLGIDSFRVTASIAERVDGNPIENLGVKPDVLYEMTSEDFTQGFAPYAAAINAELTRQLSKP